MRLTRGGEFQVKETANKKPEICVTKRGEQQSIILSPKFWNTKTSEDSSLTYPLPCFTSRSANMIISLPGTAFCFLCVRSLWKSLPWHPVPVPYCSSSATPQHCEGLDPQKDKYYCSPIIITIIVYFGPKRKN